MKKILLTAGALAASAALVLSGCSSDSGRGGDVVDSAAGFDANSLIGAALPDRTSENWVLAGQLFDDGFTAAGFEADVQYAGASNAVADQQQQISTMITNGAKVIVIGAADGSQLGTQLAEAKAAGVTIIAYDRLILNTPDVDYFIGFDASRVGELQGEALLRGLAERFPDKSTYNIELFSGAATDSNSAIFFDGAMSVLQPKIDDGTLNIVSGQTEIAQTATDGWQPENAQTRMDTILQGSYQNVDIDGVLSPNDTLARAIITSVRDSGRTVLPVVTGQDSEAASIPLIMSGDQYSTIYKDTRYLVEQIVAAVQAIQRGEAPAVNDTTSFDNGVKVMDSILLEPVIVTRENAAEAYADNDELFTLTQ